MIWSKLSWFRGGGVGWLLCWEWKWGSDACGLNGWTVQIGVLRETWIMLGSDWGRSTQWDRISNWRCCFEWWCCLCLCLFGWVLGWVLMECLVVFVFVFVCLCLCLCLYLLCCCVCVCVCVCVCICICCVVVFVVFEISSKHHRKTCVT